MAGGWRVRLKAGIRLRHVPTEAEYSTGTGRAHPDDIWQIEDHSLAAEVQAVAYDAWAVVPEPAALGKELAGKGRASDPLPTIPGTPCDEKTGSRKDEEGRDRRHADSPLQPEADGVVRRLPPLGPQAAGSTDLDILGQAENGPLDEAIDEEELIWPVARNGLDDFVDEAWGEFERAEEAAVEDPPEVVADEEALFSAFEPLDAAAEMDHAAASVQDDISGIDEWEDTLDRFGTTETIIDFDASQHPTSIGAPTTITLTTTTQRPGRTSGSQSPTTPMRH